VITSLTWLFLIYVGRENLQHIQHSGSGSYTTPSNQNESAGFPTAQPQWTPDFRHPSFLPSAAQDDLTTLTSCQSRPQPDTNYDLTEVTPYGSSLPGLDLTTYQPLSQPRINYNLTEVTPYGSSQFSNLNELCPQTNVNYNLAEVTPYGSSEPNSLNGPCPQPNINYSLTEATLYGSALIGPNPEPRAHFPTLPTAIQ